MQDEKYANQIIRIENEEKDKWSIINYLEEDMPQFGKIDKIFGNLKYQSDSTNILYETLQNENNEITNLKLGIECYGIILQEI